MGVIMCRYYTPPPRSSLTYVYSCDIWNDYSVQLFFNWRLSSLCWWINGYLNAPHIIFWYVRVLLIEWSHKSVCFLQKYCLSSFGHIWKDRRISETVRNYPKILLTRKTSIRLSSGFSIRQGVVLLIAFHTSHGHSTLPFIQTLLLEPLYGRMLLSLEEPNLKT